MSLRLFTIETGSSGWFLLLSNCYGVRYSGLRRRVVHLLVASCTPHQRPSVLIFIPGTFFLFFFRFSNLLLRGRIKYNILVYILRIIRTYV